MTKFQERKDNLLSQLLDSEIYKYGRDNILLELVTSYHFTKNDLIKLGFETIDIDEAIKESKKYN